MQYNFCEHSSYLLPPSAELLSEKHQLRILADSRTQIWHLFSPAWEESGLLLKSPSCYHKGMQTSLLSPLVWTSRGLGKGSSSIAQKGSFVISPDVFGSGVFICTDACANTNLSDFETCSDINDYSLQTLLVLFCNFIFSILENSKKDAALAYS